MNDVVAQNLAVVQLKRAEQGDTMSRDMLKLAQSANVQLMSAKSGSSQDAALARRAVLARKAYDARMTAEVGRVRAAYALLAADEGKKAVTARVAAARVTRAQDKEVFIEKAKAADLRRNIMLQAANAAERAFDAAPPLPKSIEGYRGSASSGQATVGLTNNWRPPAYVERAGEFFPSDIRAAASSLRGLSGFGLDYDPMLNRTGVDAPVDFLAQMDAAVKDGAQRVESRAHELAKQVTGQEPGTAELSTTAERIVQQLRQRQAAESTNGIPWLHIAGGVVAFVVLNKVLS